jgi:hypothetical protein
MEQTTVLEPGYAQLVLILVPPSENDGNSLSSNRAHWEEVHQYLCGFFAQNSVKKSPSHCGRMMKSIEAHTLMRSLVGTPNGTPSKSSIHYSYAALTKLALSDLFDEQTREFLNLLADSLPGNPNRVYARC